MDDPDDRSKRQIARSERRGAGDQSATLARVLMKLGAAAIPKLELDPTLRASVDRARRVTAQVARRRAERELAGELRRVDMADVAARIERVKRTGAGESGHLHLAEQWREKLLAGGVEAAADLPGGADPALPQLIARARSERDAGKPPGAGRALFRHIAAALKADLQRGRATAAADAEAAEDADDAADPDDDAVERTDDAADAE